MFSGAFSIVYVFARILWFAHLQGMKLKENDKKVSVTVICTKLLKLHLKTDSLHVALWLYELIESTHSEIRMGGWMHSTLPVHYIDRKGSRVKHSTYTNFQPKSKTHI